MKKFIFDVDGTLTPSRGRIDKAFEEWFLDFCTRHDVYLVTGSDNPKTIEQVGESIGNTCKRIYNCSGSDVYEKGKNTYTSEWSLPRDVRIWLQDKLEESSFPLRTGLHIEERPGMVNFSIVGRNATMGERKLYAKYDTENNERNLIAELFEKRFPKIQAKVGGETGIDIFPLGSDKSQILRDFKLDNELYFFGDRMDNDGNDYPLKKIMLDNDLGICYNVRDYVHTWELLKTL
jgi:phosphomannomutase